MKPTFYISIIIFILTLVSCDRIRNKGQELADKTEQKVKDKSKDIVDKVVPRFDAYEPDTKYNKERFKDFLKIDLTQDIKNIYCFDDAIGIDADYMFSFNCDPTTAKKIIEKHQLKLDTATTDYAFGLQHDFEWWDKKKIEKLDLYSWHGEHQHFIYFWYDQTEQKAYYFDFDM
ncbi:MAG TPA: hypothetical protein VKY44_00750 [Flavobacterium sp.]|nr:hypothetical protein [Flavobacterium sp.]